LDDLLRPVFVGRLGKEEVVIKKRILNSVVLAAAVRDNFLHKGEVVIKKRILNSVVLAAAGDPLCIEEVVIKRRILNSVVPAAAVDDNPLQQRVWGYWGHRWQSKKRLDKGEEHKLG